MGAVGSAFAVMDIPAWQLASERLGGRLFNVSHMDARALEAESDGILVRLDLVAQELARGSSMLRASASAAATRSMGLRLARRQGKAPTSAGERFTMGAAALDELLHAHADDVPLARAWLDARGRQALLDLEHAEVDVHGPALAAVGAYRASASFLVTRLRATAALVGGGRRLVKRWRDALAAAEGWLDRDRVDWPDNGLVVGRLVHRGRRVEIATLREGSHSRVRMVVELDRRAEPFLITRAGPPARRRFWQRARPTGPEIDGYVFPLGTSPIMPAPLRAALEQASPLAVHAEGGQAELVSDDLDPAHWPALLAVADALGGAREGVYR
jgi:hypothetical protein